ncbi:hypothetical protein QO239_13180 [Cupriavidus taiwanensis]|uniref:hypothetical protein n=1 Tax=Cupriavidus taiwanensis TaxID=164546 RepID=UPI00253F90D5|nr:hypothetical protein [Cupriavidus taiwanensis]MDK3023549.1 hypothetical protein [Cupriavidus taiwanensis]
MKINQYYQRLNKKSQAIYASTLERPEVLVKGHSAALDLHRLRACIGNDEATMLDVVCSQYETSCLALSYGLYRSAFASLRLSLEFGVGALYFSTNKLAYREWRVGLTEADIKWSVVNSPDSGVFSSRFAAAFFPALKEYVGSYRERASQVYRALSEYVHGNNFTWKETGLTLSYNSELQDSFLAHLNEVSEIVSFGVCCRYLNELDAAQLDEIEPILVPEFTHIEPIRVLFGGPRDGK